MFEGCFTAIVTPFCGDGIDFAALTTLLEKQVSGGVAGVVPCGTTGESPTLSHDEHRRVIAHCVEVVRGRVQVIAGCGSNATREAVELTRFAAEVGADATLQVVPYYNRPAQHGLFEHFAAIAEAAPIPVMLYNIPGRSGVDLLPETVLRLAEIANIVAIKEATGSLIRTSELCVAGGLDVLSGDDTLTLPMMAVGARGVVSVASNVVPEQVVALCAAVAQGDMGLARALHHRLWPLFRALFCDSNPVPVKYALGHLGLCGDSVRAPLAPMQEANAERVSRAVEAAVRGVLVN